MHDSTKEWNNAYLWVLISCRSCGVVCNFISEVISENDILGKNQAVCMIWSVGRNSRKRERGSHTRDDSIPFLSLNTSSITGYIWSEYAAVGVRVRSGSRFVNGFRFHWNIQKLKWFFLIFSNASTRLDFFYPIYLKYTYFYIHTYKYPCCPGITVLVPN